MSREHHKPALTPGYTFDWLPSAREHESAQRLASETSWALLDRVRSVADPEVVERVVKITRTDGIDEIAELWADADPHSLAGVLWRLYVLRGVIEADPEGITLLFRRGVEVSVTADQVVAGAVEPATPASIAHLCDTILRGVFSGDFAVSLNRAASLCRLLALGSASIADDRDTVDDVHAALLTQRALHYSSYAEVLRIGAERWRSGTLG